MLNSSDRRIMQSLLRITADLYLFSNREPVLLGLCMQFVSVHCFL